MKGCEENPLIIGPLVASRVACIAIMQHLFLLLLLLEPPLPCWISLIIFFLFDPPLKSSLAREGALHTRNHSYISSSLGLLVRKVGRESQFVVINYKLCHRRRRRLLLLVWPVNFQNFSQLLISSTSSLCLASQEPRLL